MTILRIYGFTAGVLVGGAPFWLLGVVVEYRRAAGLVTMAAAALLSATAFRTPTAWALGVPTGAVGSGAALAYVIGGGDWRMLVYIVLLAVKYYLAAATALIATWALTGRSRARG